MIKDAATLLLDWYAKHGRDLPWRVKGGPHPSPYVVLVSEFMLQQTNVKTVIPYFTKFMQRFPTIYKLASASIEEVYNYWQGLGYYTRARSLHSTANTIVNELNGNFPQSTDEILKLKGIGTYTAASISSLAFNLPETAIDGNVIRIISRLYHLTQPVEEIKSLIHEKAKALNSISHPADYTSAIMDLGALICTPKKPQCLLCPWQQLCLSKNSPDIEKIPARHRLEKKTKQGRVYLVFNHQGEILIRKRTEKGLLSGLYEFPWTENNTSLYSAAQNTNLEISHIFTHIKLSLKIYTVQISDTPQDGFFIKISDTKNYALSTLMKKIYQKAQENNIFTSPFIHKI